MEKSTVEEIRQRFDADVERFSNLESGQTAAIDSALCMRLIAETAAATTPHARNVLDVGCGAGNYTLQLLEHLPGLQVTLVDLSQPMLDRAVQRISARGVTAITTQQGDLRELEFGTESQDIILAAAVLHHLRDEAEWTTVFGKLFRALRPGGSFWVFDMLQSQIPAVQDVMWRCYGEYLTEFRDDTYRDHVFAYIEREDTPRPLMYQLDLLRAVGFRDVEVLHKNGCFAAFGGMKPASQRSAGM